MSDRSIVTYDEIKTALLYYAHTHSGYTLMNLGSRLFMVHKDEERWQSSGNLRYYI